jgi:hypothetical protein
MMPAMRAALSLLASPELVVGSAGLVDHSVRSSGSQSSRLIESRLG